MLTRGTMWTVAVLATAWGIGAPVAATTPGLAPIAVLTVSSDPVGATVYVDGRVVGRTPLDVPALPAGDHRVRLVRDGYLEHSRVVKIGRDKSETLHVRLTARAVRGAQAAGLRIVVIDGEDAVNIIQQKTAVAPVVEVRDRNDLPVAGVPVTFTIAGQNAAFGSGLQTVTLTTNAAGRAAVTGLNPIGSGAVQINVSAAYQGQTVTATISQTNFATAAAAAQAGATLGTAAAAGATAAAGAGAVAGGGGLSGLAIAGIVGGAAAGGLVVLKAASGGNTGDQSSPQGPPQGTPCVFTVSPVTLNAGSAASALAVNLTIDPPGCAPATWTASSNASFISIGQTVGNGPSSVLLNIDANTSGLQRTGTATIAGRTVEVTQGPDPAVIAAAGTYTLQQIDGSSLPALTVASPPNPCPGFTDSGTLTLMTNPEVYELSERSHIECPFGPGAQFNSRNNGSWSVQGGTITFTPGGTGQFFLGPGTLSGSTLIFAFDAPHANAGNPPLRVISTWRK